MINIRLNVKKTGLNPDGVIVFRPFVRFGIDDIRDVLATYYRDLPPVDCIDDLLDDPERTQENVDLFVSELDEWGVVEEFWDLVDRRRIEIDILN